MREALFCSMRYAVGGVEAARVTGFLSLTRVPPTISYWDESSP